MPKQSQFKPNFKKAKMNVNTVLTKAYENKSNWAICENEPNTNPNKPNFKGNIMLPRITINPRRGVFRADRIQGVKVEIVIDGNEVSV
jgi:hypothetical protein